MFFKQQTSYGIPKRAWSSDVCSSDLSGGVAISPLAIGKKATIANVGVRITASQYKPGSAWVILTVQTDDQ